MSGGDKDLEKVVHVDKPLLWQFQNLESTCYCKSSLIDVFFWLPGGAHGQVYLWAQSMQNSVCQPTILAQPKKEKKITWIF